MGVGTEGQAQVALPPAARLVYAPAVAEDPTSPSNPVKDLRTSGIRVTVAFGSLLAGQVILGERNIHHAIRRAAVGAGLTELTSQVLRLAQSETDLDKLLDPLMLASYGETALAAFVAELRAASLRNRIPL